MNKEKILSKAQNKGKKLDEMEVDIMLRSNHVGLIVGLIVCVIIMGVKIYLDQPYQDIYAVFCSILCGQYLYKWVRLKDKNMLFVGIVWGITTTILLIGYFL